ncbi:MAG: AsmA family protein [Bacteroidetes bacterium]|nr:AsmA family protein [Bacteroidota bacterium]
MTKPVKWTLIVLSIPVALFIILAVTVKIMLTESVIISNAVPALESQLHRKVTIGGAKVEVFPSLGIVLSKLEIADDSSFSKAPFVSFNEFRLGLKWLPLLTKSIEVSEVGVDGLKVSVIKNEEGVFNFASMIPASDTTAAVQDSTQSSGELPVQSIALDDVFLTNFSLTFDDQQGRSFASIDEFNYHLNLDYGSDSVEVNQNLQIGKITFRNAMGSLVKNLPLSLKQTLSYEIEKSTLNIRKTEFTVANLALNMSGKVENLKDSIRTVDLSLSSGETDLKQFLSLVPADVVKDITKIETKGTFSFAATAKGKVGGGFLPEATYSMLLKDGFIKYTDLPAALSNLNVDVNGTEKSVSIKNLSGEIKNSKFSVKANVEDFKNPVVDLDANVALVLEDVKSFYPMGDSMSVGGGIKAVVTVNGPALNPKGLKGTGNVTFTNMSFSKKGTLPNGIQSINGTFVINNDMANLQKLKMVIGTTDLELNGKVENYLGFILNPDSVKLIPKFSASLASENFNVGDLVDLNAKPKEPIQVDTTKLKVPQLPRVEGRFNASIKKFAFTDITATNILSQIDINDQTITLSNTKANLVGGSVSVNGKVILDQKKGVLFDLATDVSKLQANDMFRMFPSIEKMVKMAAYLKGDVSANVKFNGGLSDSLTLLTESLYGIGSVTLGSGSLSGHPIQTALGTYLKAPEWQNLSVSGWTAGLEIKEGKLFLSDLKASAVGSEITGDGWQALDQTIGYELTLALPKSMSSSLESTNYGKIASQYMTDKQGRVIVDLNVGGTFMSPTIKPDPNRSAGRATDAVVNKVKEEVNQKVDEAKEAVQDKVNEEAEKLKAEAEKQKNDAIKKAAEEAKKKLKIKWP